jgi:hypothetical protein
MIHRSWGLSGNGLKTLYGVGSLVESQIQVLGVIVSLPSDLDSVGEGNGQAWK